MSDATNAIKSITPKKREQIHTSFMDMLSVCQLRAMFRYKLGIRRPPAVFMHVGTAVDTSVSRNLQNKIDMRELLKRDDAIEIAGVTFDERSNKEPVELDPDEKAEQKSVIQVLGEAKDKTIALAGLHYDEAAPIIQPKYVQRKFSINMDGWLRTRAKQLHASGDDESNPDAAKILHAEARAMNSAARIGIDLAGEQDIVEEFNVPKSDDLRHIHIPVEMKDAVEWKQQLIIRDTKTSGKSPTKTIVDDSDQLTTYSLASLVFDKKLPDAVGLDYLVYTPKKHDTKFVPLTGSRTMDDVNVLLFRFARSVHSWHTACKTGAFQPAKATDWQCSQQFCGYFDMCPAAKRPKSVAVPLVQISAEVTE